MVRILPFLAKGKEKITECGNYNALWSSSDIIYMYATMKINSLYFLL
jgi:hypothetical protein